MKLSYSDKLKLENTKEHLQIVLRNTADANRELNIILASIEDARSDFQTLQNLSKALDDEIISQSKKSISIQEKIKSQTAHTEYLNGTEKKLAADIDTHIGKLNSILRQVHELEATYGTVIRTEEEKIEAIKAEIINLEDQKTSNEKANKEQSRKTKKQEDEYARLNYQIEEAQQRLTNLNKAYLDEMDKTTQLIQIEKDKIKNPLELILTESAKLDTKTRNMEIIGRRLTEQFKKQNPEKNLPIELQEHGQ